MKVLVTGVGGQLGHDVVRELEQRGHEVTGVGREEMDITDAEKVRKIIRDCVPDAVIHCSAYTAVDRAEDEADQCRKVNVEGTKNIAEICAELDCKMIYISTDFVFSGEGERPWETDDAAGPISVYGRTKYEGEDEVKSRLDKFFIVRISWVFGKNGNNFVKTMLRIGKENGAVKVVDDQIGSPTYTRDMAVLLADMVQTEKYGVYHASNEGFCSWYDFAKEIFRLAGMDDVSVTPITSDQFPAKAKRPFNSLMSKEKLVKEGFNKLPSWQDALKRYLQELGVSGS